MSELHTILGRLLKAERERQNKSLADVAEDLKIAEGHLLAIEAGDIGGVPSELYFKLFARSYADALGIDYQKAIEMIREDMNEPLNGSLNGEPERAAGLRAAQPSPASATGQRQGSFWIFAAIGLVIIAAVIWLVLSDQDSSERSDGANDSTSASDSERTDDSIQIMSSANRENMALNLDLVARDRTWALVIADGDTTLQTNLKPWREYYIGARDSLIVSIGAPLAVEMMLNGTSANLTDPEDGSISSVVITPENLSMYIRRALDDSLRVADSTRDSTAQVNTVAPKRDSITISGTGSSPSKPVKKDTASGQRGTEHGN
jgi:transcriptional regulator with XRE-family HTH domain